MQNAHRLQLVGLGKGILNAARSELTVSMRFLSIALSALGFEMNLSTRYVGTDGYKILFNTKYLADMYQADRVLVNRTYLHMVMHCVFRHMLNRNGRNEQYWNMACDIAIEAVIDSQNNSATKLTVSDLKMEIYTHLKSRMKVLSAQGIYRSLLAMDMSEIYRQRVEQEFWADDHSFWDTDNDENNDDNNSQDNQQQNDSENERKNKELEQKWQEISQKMGTSLETFEKDKGQEAGDMLSYIKVENRKRYSYKQFLRRFAVWQEEMHIDDDAFDYVFYTYGLSLYGNMPLIEALEYKDVQKIQDLVIVIDTSESCTEGLTEAFLSETYSILKSEESFFRKMNVHIIQCDTKVESHEIITSVEDMESYMSKVALKGAGGTDFRPAFDYVNNLVTQKIFKNLKGLIYFTDGYGVFPKKCPPYDVVFAFFNEDYTDLAVPPWAMKLVLGPEEFPEVF